MEKTETKKTLWGRLAECSNTGQGKRLITGIKDAASRQIHAATGGLLSRIPEELRRHVDFNEQNKRLFISHDFLIGLVAFSASLQEDIDLEELVPDGDGYICRAKIKGKAVRLKFIVEQMIWDRGQCTVVFLTPDGVEFQEQPLLHLLTRTLCSLFGGTSFGEWLFSSKLPPGVTWNGKRAICSFAPPLQYVPEKMRAIFFAATVSQDSRGLWFKFNGALTLAYLFEMVLQWLGRVFPVHRVLPF